MFLGDRPSQQYHDRNWWGGANVPWNYRGRCSDARSSKVYLDMSQKSKLKIKFDLSWTHPCYFNMTNFVTMVPKSSLQRGFFTCKAMGRLFSVVPPSKRLCPKSAFWSNQPKARTDFNQNVFILILIDSFVVNEHFQIIFDDNFALQYSVRGLQTWKKCQNACEKSNLEDSDQFWMSN